MRHLPHFSELVAASLSLIALLVVAYAAVVMRSEQAQGAVIGLVAAATGFWMRGKVERPAP